MNSKFAILLISIFTLFSLFSCASNKVLVEQNPNTHSLDFDGTLVKALPMQANESAFFLEYKVTNKSDKDIYQISATIYFVQDDKKIQEIGPISLYDQPKPLRQNYTYQGQKLLKSKPFDWDGKEFKIQIIQTKTQIKK